VKKIYGLLLAIGSLPVLVYFFSRFNTVTLGNQLIESYVWLPGEDLNFSFFLDGLSLLFAILVVAIGLLILLYSNAYMQHHGQKGRFYAYMLIFKGSMLGLVLSGNLITLYLFWSLTSLSSFLLIGFYHKKPGSRKAGLEALIVTETGGLAMLAGFILMGIETGTYEIPEILSGTSYLSQNPVYPSILILILLGAFTKSAQFPFHFWLPSAMKAPSPVSAYLHSASMVNAGVYLLARLLPVLGHTLLWKYILMITGLVTFLTAVYISLSRRDIKSILAYTTISSLGLMVFLLGSGTSTAVKAALLYLVIHALFKSTLFMIAGIIDEKSGTRDIYVFGHMWKNMKITAIITLLALLSMAGMPPLIGYIGKEVVYEATFHDPLIGNLMIAVVVLSNAFMFFVSAILGYQLIFKRKKDPPEISGKPGLIFTAGAAILALTGLVLAFFPGNFEPLLRQAVMGVVEKPVDVDLGLWHGFNNVFWVSMLTLVLGFIFFNFRKPILIFFKKINNYLIPVDFSDLFNSSGRIFGRLSSKTTLFLQHGYQRIYLLVIFVVAGFLLWFLVLKSGIDLPERPLSELTLYIAGIALVTWTAAIAATLIETKLAVIVTMGVVGYGIAAFYFIFSAVDLAITQILVETLVLVIFVMVVYKLPRFQQYSSGKTRLRDALIALFTGGSITAILMVSNTADGVSVFQVSEVLASKSYLEAHGRNIVNVILVDFRALDTLGEITVVLTGAIGIFAMLSDKFKKKKI
jgi:multicomponent Na+:H+ antiporter subunit A